MTHTLQVYSDGLIFLRTSWLCGFSGICIRPYYSNRYLKICEVFTPQIVPSENFGSLLRNVFWDTGMFKSRVSVLFASLNCLQCRKMPLQKMGLMERVLYEEQFLPLLPPSVMVEGTAAPQVRYPCQFY